MSSLTTYAVYGPNPIELSCDEGERIHAHDISGDTRALQEVAEDVMMSCNGRQTCRVKTEDLMTPGERINLNISCKPGKSHKENVQILSEMNTSEVDIKPFQ